jgi:hypothetical protein
VAPRVVILLHPGTTRRELSRWAIRNLADVWLEQGIEVEYLAGLNQRPRADALFVHIDLSVVPDEFLSFAATYPVAINGKVRDIRKSTISRQRLLRGDDWTGPAIVKSNLNCCGLGERVLIQRRQAVMTGTPRYPFPMRSQLDYRVYERAELVPPEYFEDPNLVIERFLPEREGELYFCRSHHFLGSKSSTVRLGSKHPIVLGHNSVSLATVEPHQDVLKARVELGLDYGKIDYVVYEGRAVIIDVNKTTGEGAVSHDPRVLELRRHRASGIWDFLPRR